MSKLDPRIHGLAKAAVMQARDPGEAVGLLLAAALAVTMADVGCPACAVAKVVACVDDAAQTSSATHSCRKDKTT